MEAPTSGTAALAAHLDAGAVGSLPVTLFGPLQLAA